MIGTADQENELGDVLSSTLKPLPGKSSNWLSADLSVHLEFQVKLNLALCYLSKLIREHPSWPDTFTESDGEASYTEEYMIQYEKSNDSFKQKLYAGFDLFEQRFSLTPCYLISSVCFPFTVFFFLPFMRVCDHWQQYIYSDYSLSNSPFLYRSYSYFAITGYGTLGMM
jgi:hypothetical protein